MTKYSAKAGTVAELVASAGITAGLTIAYIIYTGRVLGPPEYADFAAGLSVVYFVGVALSPLTPLVARLCARYTVRGDHDAVASLRRRIVRGVALTDACVAIAAAAAFPFIARSLQFRSSLPLMLAFLAALIYALISVDRGVVHGLLLFRVHNLNTLFEAVIRAVLAVVLFRYSATATAALWAYFAALVLAEVLLTVRLRREWRADTNAAVDWVEVRRLALPLAFLMLGAATFQNTDMLVVKAVFPAATSGAYGAATSLARAVGILFVPLYVMAGPILSGLHESGRPVFRATLGFTALFLALAAIPLMMFAFASPTIVTGLYGPAFHEATVLLLPLAGIAVVMYTGLMLAQALITIGDHRFLFAYAALAVVQVLALIRFHAAFVEIFQALYAVQSAALLVVALYFVRAWIGNVTPRTVV
jgi:O-antigen/teichoic acid export membrane protein